MNVKDKVVAITGAAGGLGSAMVDKLASNGAIVWALDLREDAAKELAADFTARGMKVFGLGMNVSSEADWDRVVKTIVAESGRLDVVVNLAAINIRNSVETMTIEEWCKMMEINTGSVFLSAKYAIPVMRAQGGGCFINISSICGLIGHLYTTEAYTASKGAVTLLTKAIASRYGHEGIRANSVHPSTIDTPFVTAVMTDPVKRKQRLDEVPLGRFGTVDDVANAVLYLASEEASFINGLALTVDGGMTCY